MWEQLLPLVPEIVAVVLGLIASVVVRNKWVEKEVANQLRDDVSGVVSEVYNEYVRARKKANEDGKLTDEEKKAARDLALKKLASVGKEKGVDYAKKYGVPLITGLIEKYVTKKKKGNEE